MNTPSKVQQIRHEQNITSAPKRSSKTSLGFHYSSALDKCGLLGTETKYCGYNWKITNM
jgi:hypothetical protein